MSDRHYDRYRSNYSDRGDRPRISDRYRPGDERQNDQRTGYHSPSSRNQHTTPPIQRTRSPSSEDSFNTAAFRGQIPTNFAVVGSSNNSPSSYRPLSNSSVPPRSSGPPYTRPPAPIRSPSASAPAPSSIASSISPSSSRPPPPPPPTFSPYSRSPYATPLTPRRASYGPSTPTSPYPPYARPGLTNSPTSYFTLSRAQTPRVSYAPNEEKEMERYAAERKSLIAAEQSILLREHRTAFELAMADWEVEKLERQLELVKGQWEEYGLEEVMKEGLKLVENGGLGA